MSETVATPDGELDAVRPVVRTPGSGRLGLWLFAAVLVIGGLLMFQLMSARRAQLEQPVLPAGTQGGTIAAPPPLALPPGYAEPVPENVSPYPQVQRPPVILAPPVLQAPPRPAPRVVQQSLSPDDLATLRSQAVAQGLVPAPPAPPPPAPIPATPIATADRVTAMRLANPSQTVAKGTIVAAVLETALDSSRPGPVRAIVSRDVKSFDGKNVLIPRGSRLYGEYAADVSAGQKRALIRWERLTRPDAVIMNLDSPSADPLGRAGVEGKVNSHFLARFGPAILQSILDIGVGLATRSVNDNQVVVALPGATQQVTAPLRGQQAQPTLRVNQGTSVSVFVAKDLDFSTVEP